MFGAATNREIVQRSVDLLRFIAKEGEFSEHHIDGMFSVITSPNADLRITACKVRGRGGGGSWCCHPMRSLLACAPLCVWLRLGTGW